MRVGHFAQPLCQELKTGIGWYTYKLIYELISSNIETEIYGFDFLNRNNGKKIIDNLFSDYKINTNYKCKINPYILNGLYSRFDKFYSQIPFNSLFNSNVDIHHAHNYFLPYKLKSPSIVTIYDMVYKLYPETMDYKNLELLKKIMPRSITESTKILTISENSKKEIVEILNVNPNKISIAYPGYDKNEFKVITDNSITQSLKKLNLNKPFIFYLGTLEPRKNLERVIKAYASIGNYVKTHDLVLAGSIGWKSESLFKLIEHYKLQDNIKILGYISQTEKVALYNKATCFIFPSIYEGFGMPVLEAMACGCPVITSNTSSLPEVVGKAGLMVDPYNIDEISSSISRLINDSSLQQSFRILGLEQANKFKWKNTANSVIDLYKSIK